MPVYVYRCPKCGKVFEATRRMADRNDPIECPECGQSTSEQVPTKASFVLKGTGWYATDYKGKK